MRNMKSTLGFLLLTWSAGYSISAIADTVVKTPLAAWKIELCKTGASLAKNVASETIKAGVFNAMPEVLKQTTIGTPERAMMTTVFQSPSLITPVLMQAANLGAGMMPDADGKRIRREITDLIYEYVRNSCIVDATVEQIRNDN